MRKWKAPSTPNMVKKSGPRSNVNEFIDVELSFIKI